MPTLRNWNISEIVKQSPPYINFFPVVIKPNVGCVLRTNAVMMVRFGA